MDVNKTDTKLVFDSYDDFADHMIEVADEKCEPVSVIASREDVESILCALIRGYDVGVGTVEMQGWHCVWDVYRLTIDEDYVVDVEYIGNAESGYKMDLYYNTTYLNIDTPLSAASFLDELHQDFETVDIHDNGANYYDDEHITEDIVNEVTQKIDSLTKEYEKHNQDKHTKAEVRKDEAESDDIEEIELGVVADGMPNITFNVQGDVYYTYYPPDILT